MTTFTYFKITVIALLTLFVFQPAGAQLLPDFIDEAIPSPLTKPVGLTFDETGNAYIWEQSGLVYIMDTSGTVLNAPLIDIREEVSEFVDHGLLGFTLHPRFLENGYIYLMYVVDPHHLFYFGTDDYNPSTTIINEATIGRITRYTADINTNFRTIVEDSRKVILGTAPDNGFPIVASSHGVGTLAFGTDGTLLASCGETGSFVSSDAGNHPDSFFEEAIAQNIIRPEENVGAYRSQMLKSLNGKVIRIDPETGLGIPSNPYYDPNAPDAPESKVWLRGLRNPFRMYLDYETGSHNPEEGNPGVLYIGDVGSSKWEELNIAPTGGMNFGWPIYEGMNPKETFTNLVRPNRDAPNPTFEENGCEQEFYTFHDLIQQPNALISPSFFNPCDGNLFIDPALEPSTHDRPAIAWLNANQISDSIAVIPTFDENGNAIDLEIETAEAQVEGIHFEGSSSIAGFHYIGENYPEEFHGRYFHADFDGWISVFDFDENYKLIQVDTFAKDVKGIVDFKVSPYDGCIYYVKPIEGPGLHRICYGGDPLPVAIADADIQYGPSPLTVNLDASQSYHPGNYPYTVEWQLPDGTTSTESVFEYTFESSGNGPERLDISLTLTDSVGNTATDELIISLNNTPPEAEITSFKDGDLYPLSDFTYLPLQAEASDVEHSLDELTFQWQAFLYHNEHNHAGPIEFERESFALLEPVGCNGETYWYRVELTVSDPAGLSTKVIADVYPDCDSDFGSTIELTGEAKKEFNLLTWTNSDESNIKAYHIQRSPNKTDFITIGVVDANQNESYSFRDPQPIWGLNHYRIKVVQEDDVYDYSYKIELIFPGEQFYNVYPNPTDGWLNLLVKESSGQIEFNLYDAVGRLVYTQTWLDDIFDGIEVPIDLGTLAVGVYYFQIDNGLDTFEGSVLIAR